MKKRVKRIVQSAAALLAVLLLTTACATTGITYRPPVLDDAQGIVDTASVTLGDFMRDEQYAWLHSRLKDAEGVLIFPQVLKGGFIFGGSGGTGVLVLKDAKAGDWGPPAFYTLGSVTFGLQFGGEAAEVIMLVMSRRALDSLLSSSLKLGADASVALGPIGMGGKGDVTADFISFTKSRGLYAGISLEGSVLSVRDGLNKAYYGKDVRPLDIVVRKDVGNEGATRLRTELLKATR